MLIYLLHGIAAGIDASLLIWAIAAYTGKKFSSAQVITVILAASTINLISGRWVIAHQGLIGIPIGLLSMGGIVLLYHRILQIRVYAVLLPFGLTLFYSAIASTIYSSMNHEGLRQLPIFLEASGEFIGSQLLIYLFQIPVIWRMYTLRRCRANTANKEISWLPSMFFALMIVIVLTFYNHEFWNQMARSTSYSSSGVIVMESVMLAWVAAGLAHKTVLIERGKAEAALIGTHNYHLSLLVDELRSLKHNQENLLSSIMGYVYCQDYIGLDLFVTDAVTHSRRIDTENVRALSQLKDSGLIGLVHEKLYCMNDAGITYQLRSSESFPDTVVGPMVLCEIVGILLDNAIEAVKKVELSERRIEIEFQGDETSLILAVANTVVAEPDIPMMFRKGWSTHGNGRGFGLWRLNRIIRGVRGGAINCHCENGWFEISAIIPVKNSSRFFGVSS